MSSKAVPLKKEKEDTDARILSSLGKKDMFVSFLGANKFAFSKSLLVTLDYNVE